MASTIQRRTDVVKRQISALNSATVSQLPGYLDMTHTVVYNTSIKVKIRGHQSDTLTEIICCISQLHVSA